MKKPNYFLFAVSLSIMIFAIVVGVALFNDSSTETTTAPVNNPEQQQQENNESSSLPVNIPQLSEERADAATMVLISAPTLMPVDHAGRWDPVAKGDSCLMCHENASSMGAAEIPLDHYVDEDRSKGIFGPRFTCVTCHGLDTGDPKPAFNREN